MSKNQQKNDLKIADSFALLGISTEMFQAYNSRDFQKVKQLQDEFKIFQKEYYSKHYKDTVYGLFMQKSALYIPKDKIPCGECGKPMIKDPKYESYDCINLQCGKFGYNSIGGSVGQVSPKKSFVMGSLFSGRHEKLFKDGRKSKYWERLPKTTIIKIWIKWRWSGITWPIFYKHYWKWKLERVIQKMRELCPSCKKRMKKIKESPDNYVCKNFDCELVMWNIETESEVRSFTKKYGFSGDTYEEDDLPTTRSQRFWAWLTKPYQYLSLRWTWRKMKKAVRNLAVLTDHWESLALVEKAEDEWLKWR